MAGTTLLLILDLVDGTLGRRVLARASGENIRLGCILLIGVVVADVKLVGYALAVLVECVNFATHVGVGCAVSKVGTDHRFGL